MAIRFKLKRIWVLSLVFMMAAVFPVMADGGRTSDRRIDIYLDYNDVTLNVYRIGTYDEVSGSRMAALTDEFLPSGIDIERIWENAASVHEVASDLSDYAAANHMAPYRKAAVGSSSEEPGKRGKAVVGNLEDGVYLFVKAGGSLRVTVAPFILTMPYYDPDMTGWFYTVKAYPKCEYRPGGSSGGGSDSPGGKTVTITPSDVPAAVFPDSPIWNTIEDGPVPLANIPKLGDMGMAGYLLAALAAGVAGMAATRKGRKYGGGDDRK